MWTLLLLVWLRQDNAWTGITSGTNTVYGVYLAAKKLKHYFQEHNMRVVAKAPISEIMGNKDASGRIAKWAYII